MKSIVSLVVAGVAVFALSGCGEGSDDEGGNIQKVDILVLHEGYVIKGTDEDSKDVELDFCDNRFALYHDGNAFSGTFNIADNDNRINMFEKNPHLGESYRIDTADGQLRKGNIYDIKFNGYDILINAIVKGCNI